MNKQKVDLVVDFLNNQLDKESFNKVEAEVGSCLESGLALIFFGDDVQQLIDNNKNVSENDREINQFISQVKLTKQKFLETIDLLFETEDNIKNFAEIVIDTKILYLDIPNKVQDFLDKNDILVDEFIKFMIIDMSDFIVESYHDEDFDFNEWKEFWITEMIKNW